MKDSADKELQDFLNGSDKVSATYQSLQDEKPSAALDESILQAAQEAIGEQAKKPKAIPIQFYPMAVSVFVAVLAVSLFVNNEAEFTSVDIESFSIPVSDMPAAELLRAGDALMDIQSNANVTADAVEINANRVALPAPELEADSLQEAGGTVLSGVAEEAVQETEAIEARAMEEVILTAQRQEAIEQSATIEAMVFNEYRQNIDSWLLEIQRLNDVENAAALAEERRLFAETYPEIDIDSALADLQE